MLDPLATVATPPDQRPQVSPVSGSNPDSTTVADPSAYVECAPPVGPKGAENWITLLAASKVTSSGRSVVA